LGKSSGSLCWSSRCSSSEWRLPLSMMVDQLTRVKLLRLRASLVRRQNFLARIHHARVRLICWAVLGWSLMGVLVGYCGPITVQNRSGITWNCNGVPLADGLDLTLGSSSQTILTLNGPTLTHSITNSAPGMAWAALSAPETIIMTADGDSWLTAALLGFGTVAGWHVVGIMFKMVDRVRRQGPEGIVG
jgi:hypothetical protein